MKGQLSGDLVQITVVNPPAVQEISNHSLSLHAELEMKALWFI